MSLAPGTRIGPYEVGAQIGAGGMGEVYRGRAAVARGQQGAVLSGGSLAPAPDGQRFLIDVFATDAQPSLELVLNWAGGR